MKRAIIITAALIGLAACGGSGGGTIQDRAGRLDGDDLHVFCTSGYRPDSFEALGLGKDYDLTDEDVDQWEAAQDDLC